MVLKRTYTSVPTSSAQSSSHGVSPQEDGHHEIEEEPRFPSRQEVTFATSTENATTAVPYAVVRRRSSARRRHSAVFAAASSVSLVGLATDTNDAASGTSPRRLNDLTDTFVDASSAVETSVSEFKATVSLNFEGADVGGSADSIVSSNCDIFGGCTESENVYYDELHRKPSLLLPLTTSLHEYVKVWDRYPCYRAYLLAHVCQHVGDWFVRVASLLVMEQLSTSGAAIAHLVWSVMLPKTIFAPLGGYLADRHDRRQLMMILDLVGAVVVLGYVVAVQRQSLPLLYITTMLRSTLSSLYYPATTGIVPMLVPNAKDLQLAVTMNGWAWSTMAIFGGALAGAATAIIGLQACYVIDCFTFLLSAGIVYAGVKGNYRVNGPMALGTDANHAVAGSVDVLDCTSKSVDSPKAISFDAAQQVATYLMTCGFGWLVLMKASAGLVWGPEDVIGVQFATVRAASDGLEEDVSATSRRTGLLFSVIGIGMLIGPTMSNFWTDANFPRTLQRASWLGLVVLTVGWILISLCGNSFPAFMVCTIIRTMGSGMVWVNSTVTLQALTDPSFLGRVLAIEYTTYTLAEAFSATITGELFDAGLDKNQLSLVGAALGLIMASCWGKFHWSGCGAAQPRFNSAANGGGINKDLLHSSLELSTILDEMAVPSCQDLELGSLDGSLATVGWPEPSAE